MAPSEIAICLHEAGHAAAALMIGVAPALIELINDPSLPGVARNRIPISSQAQREPIACGAFAVEYLLFREGRLVDGRCTPVSEQSFLQIALGSNAHQDKVRFFGADHERSNQRWPEDYDRAFMNFGIELSAHLDMRLVAEIAEALQCERRLDCARIIAIGTKYLPKIAPMWKCPDYSQDNA